MLTYNEQYQEAFDYEFNAYYDYVREAYGSTALDNEQEAFYNDVADLQREGLPVPTFNEWQAENAKRRADRYAAAAQANRDLDDEIPW